jgi:hypothetical protein
VRRAVALAAGALAATAVAPAGAQPLAGPRLDYVLQCQGCHREDGSGVPGHVPTLLGFGRFLQLTGGREYLVRVPGVAHAPLGDAALAALLDWMLARFDPEAAAAAPPFDAAEVARARAVPLADADAARRALLAELGETP